MLRPPKSSLLHGFALGLTLVSVSPSSAWAGDPCPIGFAVIDVGVPEWASKELKQSVERGDPFIEKLLAVAKKEDCTEISLARVTGDQLPLAIRPGNKVDLRMSTIRAALFKKNRGFECERAAKKLKAIDEPAQTGVPVLIVRGHKRILVAVAGWSSTCVSSADADAMSEADLLRFWNQVTGKYVKDRHANP